MTVPARAGIGMRLTRAAVFSAACVTLSAAGHVLASGDSIPPLALLIGWLGVLVIAASLAGRERSLPSIAVAVLGGQLGLHAVFSAGQWCAQPAPVDPSRRVMELAARLACNDQLLHLTPAAAERLVRQAGINPATAVSLPATATSATGAMAGMPGSGPATSGMSPTLHVAMGYSLPMFLGHLLAALIAGWLLRRGEAALWRLVRLSAQGSTQVSALLPMCAALAVHALARLTALLTERVVAVRRPCPAWHTGTRLEPVALQHSVIRRGPPAVALMA